MRTESTIPTLALVGGTGRSGTTILRHVLGRHPQTAVFPREIRILTDPDGVVDFFRAVGSKRHPFDYDAYCKRLEGLLRAASRPNIFYRFLRAVRSPVRHRSVSHLPRMKAATLAAPSSGGGRLGRSRYWPRYATLGVSEWLPEYDQYRAHLMEQLAPLRYAGRWDGMAFGTRSLIYMSSREQGSVQDALRRFLEELLTEFGAGQHAKVVIDDTPGNLASAEGLLQLVPSAKFIHMYRDPRDTVASLVDQRWSPSDPALAAEFFSTTMEAWEMQKARIPPGALLEIALEDLIREPEVSLRAVCDHLGLKWSSQLLEVDLSQGNVGRWRSQFDDRTAARVAAILDPYILQYGYRPRDAQ